MIKIISLTSIPSRFKYLNRTLESLLSQNIADEIRLYIPKKYKRFTDWDGTLPKVPTGINIHRPEFDLGPATKVLPCAMDLQNTNSQILFCDDDGIHPKNWARNLFECQLQRPNEAVATWGRLIQAELPGSSPPKLSEIAIGQRLDQDFRYRFERLLQKLTGYQPLKRPIKRSGYVNLLFGVGGVIVRPKFFDKSSMDIPKEAFFVDDIWLSAQLSKNNIPIYCPANFPMPIETESSNIAALYDYEVDGNRHTQNIRAAKWCRDNLNIWL